MKFGKLLFIFLLVIFFGEIFAKDNRPTPGLQIRSDLIRQKRKKNMEEEQKEFDGLYEIGKIGGDKRVSFPKSPDKIEEENISITDNTQSHQYSENKDLLFKAALDELENYPIKQFSEKFYILLTDFYNPFSNQSNQLWKVEIKITGTNNQPQLSVKSFKKNGIKVDPDAKFAEKIKVNIMRRYERENR